HIVFLGDFMSVGSSTLTSKIRVLVARTYKAEKLYASMRGMRDISTAEAERVLSQMSNDIRSREWQGAHQELRHRLNEILRLGGSQRSIALEELGNVYQSFIRRLRESELALQHGATVVTESAKRLEYSVVLKMAFELVRHKARAQACQAIVDELESVLNFAGKKQLPTTDTSGDSTTSEDSKVISFSPSLMRKKRVGL
ncbi:MAG: hypothetical protein PHC51_14380, partial [bacterium]|nr:hypothetical protein [bacterium]